ncbi:MAG: class I SAM-dependent methyltransferase [Clostridia bacterium]|nr:class I SAM-dependent methyltransferase [Clostridia bacterium]
MQYDFLANWFEYLNDDCDYTRWSQYFIDGLARLKAGKRGLELGCGSGAFCRALAKEGYTMSGADISAPMLTKAVELAQSEGLNISFIQADARSFQVMEKYDFLLSPNDCYNYLPQSALKKAFARAAKALKKGGIFWFDVSSPCKLREKVADNIFADDREEVCYLSFNRLHSDCVEMDVTLFVKEQDGRFTRYDENHTQFIHEERELHTALEEAGFCVLAVEGHLGEDPTKSDRLNFICQRA